jgi:hypothetical protein
MHEKTYRPDTHVAFGQEDTGLSYDPDRPIDEQIKEDVAKRQPNYGQKAPSIYEQKAQLLEEIQSIRDLHGPGTDDEANATRKLQAISQAIEDREADIERASLSY